MNREFHQSSLRVRSILAFAAIVSSVLVVSGIAALADHYSGGTQVASVSSTHRSNV